MNVKAGDLALVISNPFIENIGAIIKVMENVTEPGDPDALWLCAVEGRSLLGYHRGTVSDSAKHGNQICMPDKHLRPVKGLPMTEWDVLENNIETKLRKLKEERAKI